MQKQHS